MPLAALTPEYSNKQGTIEICASGFKKPLRLQM
jgi:hypothetical protein